MGDFILKLTLKDGQNAMAGHIVDKALEIREKYGDNIDYDTLLELLKDTNFLRYPVRIEFNSSVLEKGMFAITRKLCENSKDGFIIFVHEYFKNQLQDVPALVFYHLVTVNYGDFATHNEAELFGAAIMGMEQEAYYQHICQLADQIN